MSLSSSPSLTTSLYGFKRVDPSPFREGTRTAEGGTRRRPGPDLRKSHQFVTLCQGSDTKVNVCTRQVWSPREGQTGEVVEGCRTRGDYRRGTPDRYRSVRRFVGRTGRWDGEPGSVPRHRTETYGPGVLSGSYRQ